MKHVVFVLCYLFVSAIVSVFIATHVGLFELPDGFFYFALGDFLLYNRLFPIYPFNTEIPQTIYGPVYSVFLAFMINRPFPWAMTGIPMIQIFLTFLSGLFVFHITTLLTGKNWAVVSLIVFLSMPFLFIYATVLMSESVTLFLCTLWIYVCVLVVKKKTSLPPSVLVLIGSLLTLTKNAYLPIVILSIGIWIYSIWQNKKTFRPIRGFIEQAPVLFGLALIIFWIRFNKIHHNTYALTNYTGRHLYNNVVHEGQMIPAKESSIYKEFLARVGTEKNLYKIEYEVQRFFIRDFVEKKLTENQIDDLFLRFSIAAIQQQPLAYAAHVVRVALGNLTTPPYHETIAERTQTCRFHWNAAMCLPQQKHEAILNAWKTFLDLNIRVHSFAMTIFTVFFCFGIIASLINKNKLIMFIGLLFIIFLFIQSAFQHVEGRYVIPLYGMFVVCVVYGIKTTITLLNKHARRLSKI
ncbi:MAG: hypothetical protein N3A54_03700 [Patescibacteria group bacterium]|nr:hypothetical protein [Patescibacteria group bacterium]